MTLKNAPYRLWTHPRTCSFSPAADLVQISWWTIVSKKRTVFLQALQLSTVCLKFLSNMFAFLEERHHTLDVCFTLTNNRNTLWIVYKTAFVSRVRAIIMNIRSPENDQRRPAAPSSNKSACEWHRSNSWISLSSEGIRLPLWYITCTWGLRKYMTSYVYLRQISLITEQGNQQNYFLFIDNQCF